ncbi:MAG: uroporphyrinogen-III synthase [Saprospiraceae bacterium]|nr:uroporphyrinogen-III synthase [Saprospiraceae bacterium]MCB9320583.1 uroporphyrinogen-III synthase [Lewinellaceae bacterium]
MNALLLKAATEEDILVIRQFGIPAIFSPVFEYFPCVHPEMVTNLLALENTGWIFTSKRAVTAVMKYLPSASSDHPILSVGHGCAHLLSENGFRVNETFDCATALASSLYGYKAKSWIYFCGAVRRPEIRNYCLQYRIHLQEEVVYEHRQLALDLTTSTFTSIWAFSSATLKAFTDQTQNRYSDLPLFCIGPTTADTGRSLGFRKIFTSIIPDLPAMARLYQQSNFIL